MTDEATTVYGQDVQLHLLGHETAARVIPGDTPPEGYTLVWESSRWPFKASVAFQIYGTAMNEAAGQVTAILTTYEGTALFEQSAAVPPFDDVFVQAKAQEALQRRANRVEHQADDLVTDAKHYYHL
jgi:hypothetical protein